MTTYETDKTQRYTAIKILNSIKKYLQSKNSKIHRIKGGYMLPSYYFMPTLEKPLIIYFLKQTKAEWNCLGGYGEYRNYIENMAFIKCFWLIGKFSKKNILRHFDIIEYKSNLFHEIIHYLDSLRIANYTVDKSILCSGLEYTSRPDEFNAYYQQLAFCVISEFNYILDEYIRNNNLDIVKLADELKLVPSKFNEFVAAIKNTYKGLRFNKVYNRKFIKRLTNLQLELFDELNNRNNNG